MRELRDKAYHFVISSPRSGSTWLARALNGHPEILATENRLFGMFCEIWKNANGRSSPRITADQFVRGLSHHTSVSELGFDQETSMQGALLEEYIAFLANFLRRNSGKSTLVDKVTPYLGTSAQVLRQIDRYLPDAKLIHLIRDGRDVATSGVFDWIARENEESDRYRLFVEGDSSVCLKRFFDDSLLQRWASYWTEPLQAVSQSGKSALEIRYESMLEDQADSLASIFGFLELADDPVTAEQCAEATSFAQTTGRPAGDDRPLAKTRKGIAGDWKNYFTRADARRFLELTGDWLVRLGYEADRGWAEKCPEHLHLEVPR